MSVSASSGAPLAAAAAVLPTPEKVCSWCKEDVASWALKLGLDGDDVAKLVEQKIDGAALLDVVTEEKLERWRMPGGPAGKLINAVAAILKAGGMAPTVGGAGSAGASPGACGLGGGAASAVRARV